MYIITKQAITEHLQKAFFILQTSPDNNPDDEYFLGEIGELLAYLNDMHAEEY